MLSGGPLFTAAGSGTVSGENYEVIGVVSFGIGCGIAFAPGVYSRVTSVLDWINSYLTLQGEICSR